MIEQAAVWNRRVDEGVIDSAGNRHVGYIEWHWHFDNLRNPGQ